MNDFTPNTEAKPADERSSTKRKRKSPSSKETDASASASSTSAVSGAEVGGVNAASAKRGGSVASGARRGASSAASSNGSSARAKRRRRATFDLQDAFRQELRHVAELEQGLQRACAKLAKRTSTPELRRAIAELETRSARFARSIQRVIEAYGRSRKRAPGGDVGKQLVANVGRAAPGKAEGTDVLTTTELQKLIHYSIASYGSLCAWSRRIGDEDGEILFERFTDERKAWDRDLNELAFDLLERVPASARERLDGARSRN